MEQKERIMQMEQRFDRAVAAVAELTDAFEKYAAAQADIAALEAYYVSSEWREDFAADEAGLLDADLKRGVLSEDGIWDLLCDVHDLREIMRQQ